MMYNSLMDKTQFAWAAGIVDGEGCFYNPKEKHRPEHGARGYTFVRAEVAQCGNDGIPSMLTRLQDIFGGKIYGPKARNDNGPIKSTKLYYKWYLGGFEPVQYFLCCIWPWLGDVKREQAAGMMRARLAEPKLSRITRDRTSGRFIKRAQT